MDVVAIHVQPTLALTWTADDAPTRQSDAHRATLHPGAVTVIPRGHSIAIQTRSEARATEADVIIIVLDADGVDRIGAQMTPAAPRPLPLRLAVGRRDLTAEWLGHSLYSHHTDEAASDASMRQAATHALVRHLVRQYGEGPWAEALRPATPSTAPWLRRLQAYVAAHLDGDCAPTALARAVGTTPAELKHRFEREVGVSVYGFVAYTRIDVARRLLVGTNRPLRAIARRVGLQRASQLVRLFLSTYGLHPETYRSIPAAARSDAGKKSQ